MTPVHLLETSELFGATLVRNRRATAFMPGSRPRFHGQPARGGVDCRTGKVDSVATS